MRNLLIRLLSKKAEPVEPKDSESPKEKWIHELLLTPRDPESPNVN